MGFITDNITSEDFLSGASLNVLSGNVTNNFSVGGQLTSNSFSSSTISATTFYGTIIGSSSGLITGGTFNNSTDTITFTNNTGGTFTVTGITDSFTTGTTFSNGIIYFNRNDSLSAYTFNLGSVSANTFVTGSTFVNNNLVLTRNDGSIINTLINNLSGLTVTGNTVSNSLSAATISATTYVGLPIDVSITGSTYNNNRFTFTNNTGGTFNVLFNTVTGLTINGNLTVTGNTVSNTLSATTISATTYVGLPTDINITGITYNNANQFTLTNNTGGTLNVLFSIVSGLTINGNLSVTGATTSRSLSATTVSATTYVGLPIDVSITGGTFSNLTNTITFTNNTGGTFTVTGLTGLTGNTFVTGSTFVNNNLVLTRNDNISITTLINNLSGLTINGNLTVTGSTSSNTMSATTISGLTLSLKNINTPSSPNDGAIWNDITQKTISTRIGGATQTFETNLFTQTTTVTVGNIITEATILGTGIGTTTFPADFFTVGKTVRFIAAGIISRAAGNITLRFKVGGTTFASNVAASPGGSTNGIFTIEVFMTCRTTGATGTVFTQGIFRSIDGNIDLGMANTTTNTINTTISNAIDLTYQQTSANASNTISSTNLMIQILN